jgi:hypothetical protein
VESQIESVLRHEVVCLHAKHRRLLSLAAAALRQPQPRSGDPDRGLLPPGVTQITAGWVMWLFPWAMGMPWICAPQAFRRVAARSCAWMCLAGPANAGHA